MIVLLLNAFAYTIATLYFWKKDKGITAFNYLLAYYAIIAFMGVITLYSGTYERTFGSKANITLSVIPFILCFISYIIFFLPFRLLSRHVDPKMPSIKGMNWFIAIWIIIMLGYCALKYFEASTTISLGLGEAYEMRHMEGESVFDYSDNILLKRLRHIGLVLQETTVPFLMLYSIDQIRKKQNITIAIIIIVLSFLPNFLSAIALAARGSMFSIAVKMSFFFVIFKNFLSLKAKRTAFAMGCVVLFSMWIYSFAITESRLESKKHSESSVESIARYFGESFPNLGYSFWEKVHYNPMGERLFPEFYGYTKKERFESTAGAHEYWGMRTHVPVLNFKTLFGDLYIEFGVVGALLFFVGFSCLFKVIMKGKITYYNIGISYMYFQICCMGFAGLTQLSGAHLMSWVIIFFIGIFLKRVDKQNTLLIHINHL